MQKMTKALFALTALIACASIVSYGCGGDVPVSKGVEDPSGNKPTGAGAAGGGAKTNGDGAGNASKTKAD